MANVKITDLDLIPFSAITPDDVFPIVDIDANITYKLDISGLTKYISSENNKWYIQSGETITVGSYSQKFIYGDLLIEGELLLEDNSKLYVINGNIELISGGTISGLGNYYLIDIPEIDTYVTGGTYNIYSGTTEFKNNFGDVFSVTGLPISNFTFIPSNATITIPSYTQKFVYGDIVIDGEIILKENSELFVLNGDIIITGGTITQEPNSIIYSVSLPEFDTKVSAFTYLNNTLTIYDNSGNTFNAEINTMTGLTVNGVLSATTISATTIDLCGSNGTLYTGSISGCSPIDILSLSIFHEGLSGVTISGGTFYGDGSNLTGVNLITGATNLGTGVTIFDSIVEKSIRLNSIIGDDTNKILVVPNSNTIEVGIIEQNLDIWPLVVRGNKLLNGGVSYVSGLTFNVSPLEYIIGDSIYTISNSSNLILNSGDTTYDRIDVIIADISGNTLVVEGSPSVNPEKPNIDETTQLEITFIIVPANSVTIDITSLILYNDNLGTPSEWNFGSVGSQPTRIIGSSTEQTYSGTTSIRVSGVTGNFTTSFRLTGGTSVDASDYSSIQFAIRNLSANTTTSQIRLRFLTTGGTQNGSAVFMNAAGTSNYVQYDSNNTSSWQLISIPLWRFYLTNNFVQVLEVSFNSPNARYYFDLIELIEGYSTLPPQNTWTTIKGDSSTTITASNPNATLTISGGTNIGSLISGSSTIVLNLDNNISLNSVSATTISGGTFYGNGSLLTGVSGGFTGGTVSGNTVFLSGVTANTITGDILYDTLPTSNNFNGEILRLGTGTTTTGGVYYLNSLGGWSEVDSSAVLTSNGLLGIAIGTNPSVDGMLIKGFANNSLFSGTTGSPLYISSTNGLISEYPPSGSGKVIRVVGYKLINANSILFNPDPTWVVLT